MEMGPTKVPGTEGATQPSATAPGQVSSPGQVPLPSPQDQSDHTLRTILVIVALILFYPLGLVLMYVLTKWRGWVKFLVTLPLVLFIVGLVAAVVLVAVNPKEQIQKAECLSKCQESADVQKCATQCIETSVVTPTEGISSNESKSPIESTTEEPSTVIPSGPIMEY